MLSIGSEDVARSWADIDEEKSLRAVNWDALVQYAIKIKAQNDGNNNSTTCRLSSKYNKGGVNLVRLLDFPDGTRWIARIPLRQPTPDSVKRLTHEVNTMAVVRERSKIPVPRVYAYEAGCDNPEPFVIMDFVPGNTAMDSFGGYTVHKGTTPPQFKAKFHTAMADIQVQMSAIRFQKIGSIVKCADGTYSIGALPGIGGPFDSAAHFFEAWANNTKFPFREETIRKRTPPDLVDDVLRSIRDFPLRLKRLAQSFCFSKGPFPLFHPDFYSSNMIIDSQHNILSVIDWENAFVVPWELVEFAKDLLVVPPAMDGPLYREDEATHQRLVERVEYIRLAREAETVRGLDNRLSTTLDSKVQHFAHAIWLYRGGRIGFYCDVLDDLYATEIHYNVT